MTADNASIQHKRKFFDDAAAGWEMPLDECDHNLLKHIVLTFKNALPGGSAPILDIGCGTGILFSFLKDIPFCGIDISYRMLSRAYSENKQTGIGLCQADVHKLPFQKKSVKGIIGFAVFPHLDRQDVFLSECHRVLMTGGVLAIAHLRPAHDINSFHQSIGGIIANDHLPDEEKMTHLLHINHFTVEAISTEDYYYILARKF